VVILVIKEKAYAKLNLSLAVIGKRDDGFHELETIMVPINLYDELYFEENDSYEMILLDNTILDNSILKAAKLFQETYKTKGATIRLKKRIPLEAGLAGGSADSSATLRGLNRLFKLNRPLKELEELAAKLGSDNVFCLYNHAAICRGRGELLEFIEENFKFNVSIIKPSFGILTKDVFKNLIFKEKRDFINVLNALKDNNIKALDENIYNDLYEPAIKIKPQLLDVVSCLEKFNYKVHMSGSGPTLFVFNLKRNIKKELFNRFDNIILHKTRIKKRYHN
jgi:4-diphosphocytidyl-2-C-methyl-D-erythritol kinase